MLKRIYFRPSDFRRLRLIWSCLQQLSVSVCIIKFSGWHHFRNKNQLRKISKYFRKLIQLQKWFTFRSNHQCCYIYYSHQRPKHLCWMRAWYPNLKMSKENCELSGIYGGNSIIIHSIISFVLLIKNLIFIKILNQLIN